MENFRWLHMYVSILMPVVRRLLAELSEAPPIPTWALEPLHSRHVATSLGNAGNTSFPRVDESPGPLIKRHGPGMTCSYDGHDCGTRQEYRPRHLEVHVLRQAPAKRRPRLDCVLSIYSQWVYVHVEFEQGRQQSQTFETCNSCLPRGCTGSSWVS